MSKGVFIDGHERPEVVESRKHFLRKMTECCPDIAPTEEAPPTVVPHMTEEEGEKHIVWFHDESAYKNTVEGDTNQAEVRRLWFQFIEEKDGYLALSDEQYEFEVTNSDQDIPILEIGEGYWNSDCFIEQVAKAVKARLVL